MRRADLIVASAVVLAAMLAASVAIGAATPADLQLPVHWNADAVADRWAGKWVALLILPLSTAVVAAGFAALPSIEPAVARSEGVFRAAWAGVLAVLAAADLAVVAAARTGGVARPSLHFLALGLLLLLVGNQLGKSRPMRLIGIRTPWTRANVDTWIATHRLGGKLMVAAGLLCWVFVLAGAPAGGGRFIMLAVVGSALVPAVYSYFDWSRRTRNR